MDSRYAMGRLIDGNETRGRILQVTLGLVAFATFAMSLSYLWQGEPLDIYLSLTMSFGCLGLLVGVRWRPSLQRIAAVWVLVMAAVLVSARTGIAVSRSFLDGSLGSHLPQTGVVMATMIVLAFVFLSRGAASVYSSVVTVAIAAPIGVYMLLSPPASVRLTQMQYVHTYIIGMPVFVLLVRALSGLKVDFERSERARRQAESAAFTDPLTGLLNRRGFMARATEAAAQDSHYSVVMIDIDHFKSINDQHGHDAGDEVLRHVAARLLGRLRGADLVARWGGEEFVVLLVGCDEAILGVRVAEKLRQLVESAITERGLLVTASFGVAVAQNSLDETMKQADRALYFAKERGRNRVANWSVEAKEAVDSGDLPDAKTADLEWLVPGA